MIQSRLYGDIKNLTGNELNARHNDKNRLNVAERYYSKAHNGEALSESKKLIIAKTLESTNRFLNEAFENSAATQRSDMGMFKKFALNLTNCALPNLIAFDLVIVYPMSSMSGYEQF